MKSVVLMLAVMLVLGTQAFALQDFDNDMTQLQGQVGINDNDNTNRNENRNIQGQDQGQLQGQAQGQGQAQAAVAAQGQASIQGQDQIGSVATDVQDNSKDYYLAAPTTVAGNGQQATSAYSVFGGLNIVQTEEAKQCMDLLNVIGEMKSAGWLSEEAANLEALEVYNQLKNAVGSKRVLGLLWKTRGNHLLNGFGFLACDDLWSKVETKPKTEDNQTYDGNRGYIR